MDERPETISTVEILLVVLVAPFEPNPGTEKASRRGRVHLVRQPKLHRGTPRVRRQQDCDAPHRHRRERMQQSAVLLALVRSGFSVLLHRQGRLNPPVGEGSRHRVTRGPLADEPALGGHRGRERGGGLHRSADKRADFVGRRYSQPTRCRRRFRHPPLRRDGQALPGTVCRRLQADRAEGPHLRRAASTDGSSGGSVSGPSGNVTDLAQHVINGDYGNGEERKRRLGSNCSAVQKRVNEMLS